MYKITISVCRFPVPLCTLFVIITNGLKYTIFFILYAIFNIIFAMNHIFP